MAAFYFDSSAINWLSEDPAAPAIISFITRSGHEVHTSCLTVLELVATPQTDKRVQLLQVARALTQSFHPLEVPGNMLKLSLRAHLDGKNEAPMSIDPSKNGAWAALRRPDRITEAMRLDAVKQKEEHEEWFKPHHEIARKALTENERPRIYKPAHYLVPAVEDSKFTESFFKRIITAAGGGGTSVRAKDLMEQVGPWRGYFTALGLEYYNRAARATRFGNKWNPGGIDVQQAVYLSAHEVFVSADKLQRRFMRNVCRIAGIKTRIFDYSQIAQLMYP